MAILELTLNAGDIKKAVKSDTYITGQIDKSTDMVKNAALAYNEQAGDDAYHEVKLYRTMKGAVSKFEANMSEYVDPGSGEIAVSNTLTSSTDDGYFKISIPVGNRFYNAFANTLSSLAQEYIINMMLYSWWQSIKPTLSKDYYQFAQESLEMVRKCLSKTPPNTSMKGYADVTGAVSENKAEHEFELYADKDCIVRPFGEMSEMYVKINKVVESGEHNYGDEGTGILRIEVNTDPEASNRISYTIGGNELYGTPYGNEIKEGVYKLTADEKTVGIPRNAVFSFGETI